MRGTVLVVDDDIAIRETLAVVLDEEGYSVAQAVNGREALDRIQEGLRPDLIVLDLMMPVMDGWQFLEERAKDQSLREVPVVIVSATPETLQPPEVCAFVRKPMRLDHLLEVIERECRSP
jgi:CheY-like chemotaxis protein